MSERAEVNNVSEGSIQRTRRAISSGTRDHSSHEGFEPQREKKEYLTEQLVTYIGNKRTLLDFIGTGIATVSKRLNKKKLDSFDVFSGSGVVSRFLKRFSNTLIANDLEKYSEVINRCYLANESELDLGILRQTFASIKGRLETIPLSPGFITEMYAPEKDDDIKHGERVFYTRRNAMYLDTARRYIDELPARTRHFFLGPLLSEASVHANTSGVFKGFYKNTRTGKGQFGGNSEDALTRILGNVELRFPVFSDFECEVMILRGDANLVVEGVPEVDVAYLDPPYNQHPYGSNYFLLNLLVDYARPCRTSAVSGIPTDWCRSDYNKRRLACEALSDLVEKIKAKFLLVSFNSEGFIGKAEMLALLGRVGRTEMLETRYNTFRGSRNLGNRSIHVKEFLFLVEKT
jgi:adenine-specific DNA-methyltransferase